MQTDIHSVPNAEADHPISVRYTDAALDMGSVSVPRIFLWFYPYLRGWNGDQLDPREAFFLQYVLNEQTGPESPTFRLKTLPCPFTFDTRKRYATKCRNMGLFYTKAHYKSDVSRGVRRGQPPIRRVEYVEWFFDPLFYSLSLIYQKWRTERDARKQQFGKQRIFYRLPDDYIQPVEIPPGLIDLVARSRAAPDDVRRAIKARPDVADQLMALVNRPAPGRLQDKGFYRVSPLIILRAHQLLEQRNPRSETTAQPTRPLDLSTSVEIQKPGGDLPTVVESATVGQPRVVESASVGQPRLVDSATVGNRVLPRVADSTNALVRTLTTTTTTTRDGVNINFAIAEFFAKAISADRYNLTERENRQIAALLAEGFSFEDFCAGIQTVVERESSKGKKLTLAYCLPAVKEVRSAQQGTVVVTQVGVVTELGKPSSEVEVVREVGSGTADTERLKSLAGNDGNDAEFLDLIDLIQTKNPTRQIDRGDARAWRKLADDFAAFAKERDTSPVGLVMQGVLEAIGSNSNHDGFLAPNLVRRILERWQKESQLEKERVAERSGFSVSTNESTDEGEPSADDPLQDQWARVLKRMRAVMPPSDFPFIRALRLAERVNGTVRLEVTDEPHAKWIQTHALAQLAAEVNGVFGEGIQIEFVTADHAQVVGETTTGYAARHEEIPGNVHDIWHAVLGELQLQMTKATFDTWVRPTHALGWKAGVLHIGVHSVYAKEWLENRLQVTVQRTLTGIVGRSVEMQYVVQDKNAPRLR